MRSFIKGGFLAALFFLSPLFAENFIVFNEGVLSEKVSEKINTIGEELYAKTGVFVGVAAAKDTNISVLNDKTQDLKAPFVLLALSINSHAVEIFSSEEKFFDKEEVLSPRSSKGSILPILASNKGKDIYNAALLNGYADITDRVATHFNVVLESSIGNANKNTLNIMRIGIYGFICVAILYYVQRRMKRKQN